MICAAGVLLGAQWAWGDLPELQTRGSLRVLAAADEQPESFSFAADGPPGFEREIALGFARTQALRLEVVAVPDFDQIIPMLLGGQGDLIVGIADTAARRELIDFSAEVLPVRYVAVSRRPAPPVGSLAALRAARVVLASSTSWAEAAFGAGVSPSEALMVPDLPAVLAALRSGRADASVLSAVELALAQRHDGALQAGVFIGPPGRAGWGLRKNEPKLQAAINGYLRVLRTSPVWGQIVSRYFTADALALFRRARQP